jgi:hypothetical protein
MLSTRAMTTLRLSTMSGAKTLTSSCSSSASSSMALRSPRMHLQFPSSGQRLSNGVVLRGNRVSFASSSTRFSHASLRCFASSAGSDRVRVENPIVEMDGEVNEPRVIVCLALPCLVGEKMGETWGEMNFWNIWDWEFHFFSIVKTRISINKLNISTNLSWWMLLFSKSPILSLIVFESFS